MSPHSKASRRAVHALTVASLFFLFACGGSGGSGGGGGGNPPSTPTGLIATAGDGQVSLSWTGSTGATSYKVKRGTAAGGPYTTVSSPAATSYSDTGLTNGSAYYYVVSAVNAYGESANSGEASATPSAVPLPPTGLNAVPGNAMITISWTASVSSGVSGYHLKRSTTSGGPYTQVASTPPTTYAGDTSVTNGTQYYYVVTTVNSSGESANSAEVSATPLSTITNLSLTIDVYTDRHSISPYIYGGAFPKDAATITDSGLPVVRWGGNGASTYNWQLGTSNSDNDYYFEDFSFQALNKTADSDSTQFIKDVQAAGSNPLMTMVMLPWVAQSAETSVTQGGSDNYHWVFSVSQDGTCSSKVDQYNTDAGINLKSDCSTTMVASSAQLNRAYYPLLDDHTQACPGSTCEYRSDWSSALAGAFNAPNPAPSCPIPYSAITSCHFYNMDNEIDIWGGTHVDVHPNPTTYDELSTVYLTEAAKLKTWDPQAVRLGWVSCCWYYYWNSAAGLSDKAAHANIDFMPWWLNEVAWQDAVNGTRTLDILDLHAYPETSSSGLTTAQARALTLRSTRDWWDPTYTSEAWFGTNSVTLQEPLDGKAFRIPRARAWANTIYPGTPLAFTEWNFSLSTTGESDFSTALADADAYGILGLDRVSLASRWTAPDPANPNYLALKLYTNYDGAHHGFAPISVSVTNTGDPNLFSTYAATSADGLTVTLMVVNKGPNNTASVGLNLGLLYGLPNSITTYSLAASSPSAIAIATPPITPVMNFPPYSATLLVMTFPHGHVNPPQSEWDLNPDTIVIPAGGTATLQPRITSGTTNVVIINESAPNLGIAGGGTITPTQPGAVTITVPSSTPPGFYSFSVTGAQAFPTFQNGWVIVTNPAAALSKTGDGQTGGSLTLTATLVPGSSGGTASGADILFTTNVGTLSQRIVNTDSSGNATVTLTLPSGSGTATVTAEGPYGLGHPVATFTESN